MGLHHEGHEVHKEMANYFKISRYNRKIETLPKF